MNNFTIGLKRFFTNKNIVTILLVIVILVVLYIGYSSSIKKQTNPINLPVANVRIAPQTKITGDMISYKKVANSMVGENVIISSAEVVGKYTNVNVVIPTGSVFYSEWLVSGDELPGNWIEQLDYEKGELGYYMDVNMESTLGNNVLPNTYIDIYLKADDENGTVIFGKLMRNIKILVVHDGSGKSIFSGGEEAVEPSKIGFAVTQDYYMLLKKAEYLNLDLVIVPRGSQVPTHNYVMVASSTLRDYIDAQTITAEEDPIPELIEDESTKSDGEESNNNTDSIKEETNNE